MDEFEYVTEVAPDAPPPPPAALRDVALRGAWLGGFAGFAFLGWETAVTGWLGYQSAVGVYPLGILLLYLGTGALFGTLVGVLRLGEGAWAAVTTSFAVAWLLCGHVGLVAGAGGSIVALIGLSLLALLVGYFGVAQNLDDSQAGAVAVILFLCVVVLVPVDLHHLLTVGSVKGVLWQVAVVVLASAAGSLVALLLADGAVGILGVIGGGAAVGWLAALPVLWPQGAAWPTAKQSVGPPIVLVVASGLRADRVGAYGADRPTTPRLDALASRGIVYADAATHAPWSLPAVASLLTSRLPSHHDAGFDSRGRRVALSDAAPWLPERLARRGYVTAGITTEPELTVPWGMGRGYDAYDDRTAPAMVPTALHPWRAMISERLWATHRESDAITDRAISFVAAQPPGSWFLLVEYGDLAHAERPAPADLTAVAGERDDPLAVYDARVRGLDAQIGRLLDALPPEAVIVVTSDHGVELAERRDGPGVPARATYEHSLYQEVVHVPLIVVSPGVAPGWVERTVPLLDVAPTLARVAGADVAGMDGQPLWELFPTEEPAPERPQVAERPRVGLDAKAVRDGRYKLIAWRDGSDRLFDLQVDPLERSPILQRDGALQATARELRALAPPFE